MSRDFSIRYRRRGANWLIFSGALRMLVAVTAVLVLWGTIMWSIQLP